MTNRGPAYYDKEDLERYSLGGAGKDCDADPFEADVTLATDNDLFKLLERKGQVMTVYAAGTFHNRNTHSWRVAKVGGLLAEALCREYGGPDPSLVKAACLLHDIGHPPFGHTGEDALRETMDELTDARGLPQDAFEANAQNLHAASLAGLPLTRATLDAAIKYPWLRSQDRRDRRRNRKWGVYPVDLEAFEWIRNGRLGEKKPVEAQVMDWADDVAYACHDIEDFYRTGQIPLELIFPDPGAESPETEQETAKFLGYVVDKWTKEGKSPDRAHLEGLLVDLRQRLHKEDAPMMAYDESPDPDAAITARTEALTAYLTTGIALDVGKKPARHGADFKVPDDKREACDLLKELLWYYVLDTPALEDRRRVQKQMIRDLVTAYSQSPELLPKASQENMSSHGDPLRGAADHIFGLGEVEVLEAHVIGACRGLWRPVRPSGVGI